MYSLIEAIDLDIQPETNVIDAFKTLKLLGYIEKSHENSEIISCT
jgi:hypothetical protein